MADVENIAIDSYPAAKKSRPALVDLDKIFSVSPIGQILIREKISLIVSVEGIEFSVGYRNSNRVLGVRLRFSSVDSCRKAFSRARLMGFAVAYLDGEMEIDGDIAAAAAMFNRLVLAADVPQSLGERMMSLVFRAMKAVTPTKYIGFESLEHYSDSAGAYELFLDKHMQYTCGYFRLGNETLEAAQVEKFRLIRELAGPLEGKVHLDVGCGWGGLGGYFEANFGVNSIGNTNCLEQKRYAEETFGSRIIFGDFAELRKLDLKVDLITIIGMIEHLTPYRQGKLLEICKNKLASEGAIYLQCVAMPSNWIGGDAYRLVQKEVFPGHFIDTPKRLRKRFEKHGFVVEREFDHARHYGMTTGYWAKNVERNREKFIELMGERKYRLYLGYLALASEMFGSGQGRLMRFLLRRSNI